MEAHRERAEQLRKEEQDRNMQDQEKSTSAGRVEGSGHAASKIDPAVKVLIRETIISDGKAGGRAGSGAEDPEDVLAFSRSVNKTDSSLE
ncbi:hypothetical protein CDL15_Pgr015983 [Punica granatum]|uniref:Uncharacterized protein n=1 Tax=Punica granatum TaxID=22663 RepID=A0A218XPN6_PUNGR|nr:hypothetical protein CDL15_Pgr015983 [Punica granatum]PKI55083.1 hypothetical protein CRG98_024549 [Punica granatum]